MIALVNICPKTNRTTEESLGLGYLAAQLRHHNVEVEIIDAWLNGYSNEELVEQIVGLGPVLWVGISAYETEVESLENLLKILKARTPETKILAGGYGPTFSPEKFLQLEIDAIVVGEAESIVVLINEYIANGDCDLLDQIAGVHTKMPITVEKISSARYELDSLKFPARDTLHLAMAKKSYIHLLTSRGCTANCEFCSIVAFGRKSKMSGWRGRSPNNIVQELMHLHQIGVTHIKIIDDSFLDMERGQEWLDQVYSLLIREGIEFKFRVSIRAEAVNHEITTRLKKIGVEAVAIGIENFSDDALKRMNKTARASDNCNAIETLLQHELRVQGGMILFDPLTTLQEVSINLDYLGRYPSLLIKGIHSEMFAAEGTTFTKKIKLRYGDKVIRSKMNHVYPFENADVALLYSHLRDWQRLMAPVYDKVADPLCAPKVISEQQFNELAEVLIEMNSCGLNFARQVLESIDSEKSCEQVWQEEKSNLYSRFSSWGGRVDQIYYDAGLVFDGSSNPFLYQACV